MEKKKLLVSFSGGETSAFMAQWLWKHQQEAFEMIFVFANTGQENEETLRFTEQCSTYFGFPVVWVECKVHPAFGTGTTYVIVNYDTASRQGEPFERYIRKYGIPNQANPNCTRELKQAPLLSYAKEYFGTGDFYTAIGIRSDEADRISAIARERQLIYPLINKHMLPGTTKPVVNLFWAGMPFRLRLKGYQGNCKWCWKKSKMKLLQIAREHPEFFDFPARMEDTYGNYFPPHRLDEWMAAGKALPKDIRFFRGNLSARDIVALSKKQYCKVPDDSRVYDIQQTLPLDDDALDLVGGDSCEVFAECGI